LPKSCVTERESVKVCVSKTDNLHMHALPVLIQKIA
jgi:hypothetical protein